MARENSDPTTYVICRLCEKRFRAITCFHLRNVHDYDGEHPILDYKSEYGLTYAMCKDSRTKISETKEEFWEELGQHWTPDDVLADIREYHRTGQGVRRKDVSVSLYLAGRRLFGSWKKAVEAAGFDYETVLGVRQWDRKKVIARIQQLATEGVPLDSMNIKRQHSELHRAAIKLFPSSWGKALRAARLDPEEHRVPRGGVWNRQNVEEWVRTQVAEEKSILAHDVPRDLRDFVRKRLGLGWTDFVEEVTGADYPGVKKQRNWTKEKVLSVISRLRKKGNPLTKRAVIADVGQAVVHQARKFFGSWLAGCAAKPVPAK